MNRNMVLYLLRRKEDKKFILKYYEDLNMTDFTDDKYMAFRYYNEAEANYVSSKTGTEVVPYKITLSEIN